MEHRNQTLQSLGIRKVKEVLRNLAPPTLVKESLLREEGTLTQSGALRVTTGQYTGRSPKDKFVVDDPEVSDQIWWGQANRPMKPEAFSRLYEKVTDYLQDRSLLSSTVLPGLTRSINYPFEWSTSGLGTICLLISSSSVPPLKNWLVIGPNSL